MLEVKEVIISALHLLGRREVASMLSAGLALDGEATEIVNTLLYCFNAVEDEVARKYVPLSIKEELSSTNGRINYTQFSHSPLKIKSVLSDGKEIEYQLLTQYMAVSAKKITVEYEFAPSKKKIDGASDFGAEVSEHLLALGIAAEYCLINGEIEAAELWEKKYRSQIDIEQNELPQSGTLSQGGTIPPRRWV